MHCKAIFYVCGMHYLHLGENIRIEVFFGDRANIPVQVAKGQFISVLILAVVLSELLNGVICEMDYRIGEVFEVELTACSPHISLPVPIPLQYSVVVGQHHIHPYVELASVIEKRVGDVLLQNICPSCFLVLPTAGEYLPNG